MRVLVAMEDSESPVAAVIPLARRMMQIPPSSPVLPTAQGSRRNMITPRMVSSVGVKTPAKVPNSLGPPPGTVPGMGPAGASGMFPPD